MKKNQNKKREVLLIISLVFATSVMAYFFSTVVLAQSATDDQTVGALNQDITKKRADIETLQKEIDAYQEQIAAKQKEAVSLQNQISILGNELAKIHLDLEATKLKIERTQLEIEQLNLKIKDLGNQIISHKQKIAGYLRLIYKNDQVSALEVLLENNAFSDFYDQVKQAEEINGNLKSSLVTLKTTKQNLDSQKLSLEDKAKEENKLKDELQQEKDSLSEKTSAQQLLLVQTKLTQRQYKNFQNQLQLEQQQINADIVTLEKQIRTKLATQAAQERFRGFGPARLEWPVSPSRGISAYFHDPGYPFRNIFEHPAIDIRAYQGTSLKAAESGYVGKVQFRGDTSYAYVMIIHNDGLSTVYGHVSAVYVKEGEYVSKGQAIAASGGAPGGIGSGPLTTGSHLHFEVRLNGIPVNPLEYLP